MGFVHIPAAPFRLGSDPRKDKAAEKDERPQRVTSLPDYYLARSRIIDFSKAKAPYGFPLDEAKWRVESLVTADSSQASPVAGTWYNKGGSLAVPIGRWRVEYAAELEVTRAAAGALEPPPCTFGLALEKELRYRPAVLVSTAATVVSYALR